MITNETYKPQGEGLEVPGLNKSEILEGVDALIRDGSRNYIIGLEGDLSSDHQKETQRLRKLLIEMDAEENHKRVLTLHPAQSGHFAHMGDNPLAEFPWLQDNRTSLNDEERSVIVKIPIYTERIHDEFDAHVDRVYIFNLDSETNEQVYSRTYERLSKGLNASNERQYALEFLADRHDPRFLHQVSSEIAQHLLERWSDGRLEAQLAFTEVSKVKNTTVR